MASQELSVGEVSQRSGVAVSALHFYERKGLISSLRTSGNQRRYSRDVLRRLAVIRVAQRVGMPLEAVTAPSRACLKAVHRPRLTGPSCPRAGAPSWNSASTCCSCCAMN